MSVIRLKHDLYHIYSGPVPAIGGAVRSRNSIRRPTNQRFIQNQQIGATFWNFRHLRFCCQLLIFPILTNLDDCIPALSWQGLKTCSPSTRQFTAIRPFSKRQPRIHKKLFFINLGNDHYGANGREMRRESLYVRFAIWQHFCPLVR